MGPPPDAPLLVWLPSPATRPLAPVEWVASPSPSGQSRRNDGDSMPRRSRHSVTAQHDPRPSSSDGADLGCERIDISPDGPANETELEHRSRYVWALPHVTSPVLDVACGTGHGSALLASRYEVTGLDRDPSAVQRAQARMRGTFVVASVPPLPFKDDAFASIVSFETIEHIDDDLGFVRELRRVLRPGGSLILSTPNKRVTSPGTAPPNTWHVREYCLPQLLDLLTEQGGFRDAHVFAQRYPPRAGLRTNVGAAARLRLRLGRPGGAISRAAFGDLAVQEWDGRGEPFFWVVLAR
jgi:SAM-dependent methyltransferase